MADKNIEAIYRLSPLQEGILFHTLKAPGSHVYLQQYSCLMNGLDDPGKWELAWGEVARRHAVMRTLFTWDRREHPLQIVRERVSLPWEHLDWREKSSDEQSSMWRSLLLQDRDKGCGLSTAPVMRFTLARVGDSDYRFLWTFHHILLDGWSQRLIFDQALETFRNRAAKAQGVDRTAPQYGDFIRWLDSVDLDAARSFWSEHLRGFTKPTAISSREPSPGGDASAITREVLELELDPTLLEGMSRLGREHHLTLNTLVVAAWALVLGTHCRSEDVVFGSTVSGRPVDLPGADRIAGLMINTLPMRVQIDAQLPLTDWLRTLQSSQLGMVEHQQTPLVDIQKCAELPPGTALFDSIVVFENIPGSASSNGAALSPTVSEAAYTEYSHYPLALLIDPGEQMKLIAVSQRERVGGDRVRRLLQQVLATLESMTRSPGSAVGDIQVLPRAELTRLTGEWNQTGADFPRELCTHQLFEKCARDNPDGAALTCAGETRTFAEVNAAANQLARYLSEKGVNGESLVAVFMERGVSAVISFLAVMKTGAAYIPLDADFPRERIVQVLDDTAQARPVVVTQQSLLDRLPEQRCLAVRPDMIESELSVLPRQNLDLTVSPLDLAYVIYTSGSTGRPKGVMIQHRSLVNSTWARVGFYPEQPGVFLLLSSLAVDSSVAGLYWSLCTGSELLIAPPGLELDVLRVGELVETARVSHMLCIASLYQLILENNPPERLRSLKTVIVAGEACAEAVVAQHRAALPGTRLYNEYGPSEYTVWATVAELTRSAPGQPVPIGRPIDNTELYILDSRRRPVPIGVPGELCIGGEGLARGYLNGAEATESHFIEGANFDDTPGSRPMRLYRTGDLVRYLEDGNVEFLGRVDNQIKVRGYRIEPEEIEQAIATHPSVAEVAVYLDRGMLTAAVRTRAQALPAADELKKHVRDRLPDYMVPQQTRLVADFPRTSAGKIDRRALSGHAWDIVDQQADEHSAHVGPRGAVEETLAGIWAEVLGVDRISINDDFYAIGGDSLLSIRILARANKAGLRISPEDFFAYPTIAGQAGLVASAEARPGQSGPLSEAGLSPVQRWFFDTFSSHTAHWNQSVCLRVAPHLDHRCLAPALRHLLRHHAILRASFIRDDRGPRQVIRDVEDPLPIAHLDLSACPGQEIRTRLKTEADRINRHMDLEQGRLVKLLFAQTPDREQNYLVIAIHHLVVDAESWRTLLADLEYLWSAEVRGEAIELPTGGSTFLHWCSRLEGYADSAEIATELPYWQRLANVKAHPLPLDCRAGPDTNSNGSLDVVTVSMSADETEALLRSVPGTYRTEITEVLLSGLLFAANAWTGGDSLLVDVEGHGREYLFEDLDISRSVGWFTSIYPVFLSAGGAGQASALLLRVKETFRQIPRRGIGYGVARYLRGLPQGDPPLAVQAQVSFNYLGQVDRLTTHAGDLVMESDQFGESRHPQGQRAYQLEINARIVGSQLRLDCLYSLDLHKRPTIEGFARHYLSHLRELVAESKQSESVVFSPSDFPLADLDREDMDAIAGLLSEVDDDPE